MIEYRRAARRCAAKLRAAKLRVANLGAANLGAALVAVSGLGLLSCGASQPAIAYAKLTGCDADDVDVRPLAPTSVERFTARGCGSSLEIQCWDGKCASPAFEVKRRHAHELGCAPQDVTAVDREEGYFIADGCGKRTNYRCRFDKFSVARCDADVE